MLLIDDGHGGVVAARPRLRDHLSARLHADRLDRELAGGASPDTSVPRALRARALTSACTRQYLALGLRRATANATTPAVASIRAAAANRERIRAAATDLERLRYRLLAGAPVSVRGMARTQVLLTDGSGPLHNVVNPEPLAASIRRVIDALDI